VNADFISTNDGTSYTLLMSENLQAVNWATDLVVDSNSNTLWDTDFTVRGHTGMVWYLTGVDDNRGPAAATLEYNEAAIGINDGAQAVIAPPYALLYGPELATNIYTHGGLAFARPSSNHPGGVNSAFCDGHMYYLNDEIEYHVYTQLMTPNQKAVNTAPLTGTPVTTVDAGWIYILNEAEY
jgi:prepilin-type processing-associated H-X9-DG protein